MMHLLIFHVHFHPLKCLITLLMHLNAFERHLLVQQSCTTGIGEGIAIPHAKVSAVKSPAIAFGKSKAGVDYQSLDMQPAHLFFMISHVEWQYLHRYLLYFVILGYELLL
jgi:hypothetical protein